MGINMKKRFYLIVASVIAIIFTACSSGDSRNLEAQNSALAETNAKLQSQIDELAKNRNELSLSEPADALQENAQKEETPEIESNDSTEDISDKISVQEYKYEGYSPYYVLVLKNTSDQDCDVDVGLTLYNAEGKTIGAENETVYAFQHGTEIALTFSLDEMPESAKVTLDTSKNTYACVNANLSYETSVTDDKVIVSATNNGKEKADFVEGCALFFSGDKLVYSAEKYFVDKKSTIKPGATINEELESREAFDTVKIYFNGRGALIY